MRNYHLYFKGIRIKTSIFLREFLNTICNVCLLRDNTLGLVIVLYFYEEINTLICTQINGIMIKPAVGGNRLFLDRQQ